MPTPEGPFILDLTARPDVEDALEELLDVMEPILEASGVSRTFEAGDALGALLGPSLGPPLFDALLEKYGQRTVRSVVDAFRYMKLHDDHDATMLEDGTIVRTDSLPLDAP